jgi:DNA-binding FadR family transcriptional regulator
VSVASLREQMEVARALGLIEVRPRTGIRRLPYTFRPAVTQSVSYALTVDPKLFDAYTDLRSHVEAAYWFQAVSLLTPEDQQYLHLMVVQAQDKLRKTPPQIPQTEHRELHLTIYRRLGNPFVLGLLEAYWEMYEAVGLAVYSDLTYLQQVWNYHGRMVEDICNGNYQDGYQALLEHVHLITQRTHAAPRMNFE